MLLNVVFFCGIAHYTSVDTTGGLILIKYLYMFMILPILLVCYRSIQKCDDFLISTFIAIGVLFSCPGNCSFLLAYFSDYLIYQILSNTKIWQYGDSYFWYFGVWKCNPDTSFGFSNIATARLVFRAFKVSIIFITSGLCKYWPISRV